MTNIELLIQVKEIEVIINNEVNSKPPNKTLLKFEVASYPKKEGFSLSKLKKDKNTLLAFGNMSDFAIEHIKEDDYILVKGDLREVSEEENIFLPLSIQKIGDKKKWMKISKDKQSLCL